MIGGLLFAATMAQGQPTGTAPAPSTYSLVIGRERDWRPGGEHTCINLGGERICAERDSAWYADARSLAGRPVAPDLGTVTRVGPIGWYQPALLLIRWHEPNVPIVEARAIPDGSKRACIPAAQLERIGWHPSGPEIQPAADGGVCADLTGLHALWAPDIPYARAFNGPQLPPTTLIAGRRTGQRALPLPPCPRRIDCVTFAADVRLDDVETLSGRRVPASLDIRFSRLSPLPDGDHLLVAIWRVDGHWQARWVEPRAPAGQETCVTDRLINEIAIPPPPRAQREAGQVCFNL